MAEEGLEFEYRKKFQRIDFRDMHDWINKVDRYASLLKEEMQKRTASKGTYYRNPVVSYADADGPAEDESDEVKLSFGHKIPKPEELKGKTLCKYHSSLSHNTNNCVVLRDVIQKLINEKKLQFSEKPAMQVDSKPFPPPVINMVNAQLQAEYREGRRPAKGKEPLAEPELVLCSRCKYEIGAQSPSTSVGHKDEATPRLVKTFKPPVVRDDRWYHAQPGGSAQPLTKTQLRRMQRQVQQARIQTAQVEVSKRQKKMAAADEPPSVPIVLLTAKAASIKPPRTWRPRQDGDLRRMAAVSV
ncbi:unnamed protein product [Prunus brigantina]